MQDAPTSQRDKLGGLRERYLDPIRELADDDHARVVREIKKRLKSPKLAAHCSPAA